MDIAVAGADALQTGLPRALCCRGLRKTYGNLVALDDVSFEVAAGETYGLLGPNGAGKTTAISLVAGILDADGGEVLVDGPGDDHPVDVGEGAGRLCAAGRRAVPGPDRAGESALLRPPLRAGSGRGAVAHR